MNVEYLQNRQLETQRKNWWIGRGDMNNGETRTIPIKILDIGIRVMKCTKYVKRFFCWMGWRNPDPADVNGFSQLDVLVVRSLEADRNRFSSQFAKRICQKEIDWIIRKYQK